MATKAKRIGGEFDVFVAELRLELVADHLIGLAFARYQRKIELIATTRIDRVVASSGPDIERCLTDPIAVSASAEATKGTVTVRQPA
jgi:hypothetical protein